MSTRKPRKQIPLLTGWKFRKGWAWKWQLKDINESGFEEVELPHCVNSTDTFRSGVSYYRGRYAYLKEFSIPEVELKEPAIWRLVSGGFYGTGEVFLNEKRLGKVDGQYLGFKLDVTGQIKPRADNLIAIRLTNKCGSNVLPGIDDPDFLLYGGLASDVYLEKLPQIHICDDFCVSSSVEQGGSLARVHIEYAISNYSDDNQQIDVEWTVMDGKNEAVVSYIQPVLLHGAGKTTPLMRTELEVKKPELWEIHKPYLYKVTGRIYDRGSLIDETNVRIGIRTAAFVQGEGFFLNGRKTFLAGVNRHESMPGFGNALEGVLNRNDAELIKKMGLNFVRLSHYPQSPDFLDACDELGILVYAELSSWKSVRTGGWLDNAKRQLECMIKRDRSHPSIILWGLGNESRSSKAFVELGEIVTRLDPDRPTIYAENHLYRAKRSGTLGITDVWGCNYELDAMAEGMAASRLKSVIVSECSNYPNSQRGRIDEELIQLETLDRDISQILKDGRVSGFAIWCFNDYATMRKKRYLRYSGIVDAWRIPKISFEYLKARFLNQPVLAVFADWGSSLIDDAARKRKVIVITNMSKVGIWCGDQAVGEFKSGCFHVVEVDFRPASLVVKGEQGKEARSVELQPYGKASFVRLKPRMMKGDGRLDVFEVGIEIVDDNGRLVTNWFGNANLNLKGDARLVCYKDENTADISAGLGKAYVMASKIRTRAVLKVEAFGIQPCEVTI